MSAAKKKRSIGLTTWILIAIAFGVAFGALLPGAVPYVAWMGEVFKLALKMLIAPLVLTSMITGMASLGDLRRLGRLGASALGYYGVTTLLAVTLGLVLVNLIQPGIPRSPHPTDEALVRWVSPKAELLAPEARSSKALEGLLQEAQRNLPPRLEEGALAPGELKRVAQRVAKRWAPPAEDDPGLRREALFAVLRACRLETKLGANEPQKGEATTRPPQSLTVGGFLHKQISVIFVNPFKALTELNVLGIIVFGLLLGGALTSLGPRGEPALRVFESLNEGVLKLVDLVMLIAPPGVFALMAQEVAKSGLQVLALLFWYMVTVLLGLALHSAVSLHLLLRFLGRMGPVEFLKGARDAIMVAFSTASSSATLAVSLDCSERRLGVPRQVGGFVLPLGATVNMDGTALYEAVAALFVAQLYGIELGLGQQIIVVLTATLASIGAAGIPSAGTVTMVMVLSAVGLPLEGIGLILAVDRILDMVRTAVNVMGDLAGARVVARVVGSLDEPTEPGGDPEPGLEASGAASP